MADLGAGKSDKLRTGSAMSGGSCGAEVLPGISFGVSLSNRTVALGWTEARDLINLAVRAEDSGVVGSVWVGDSLIAKPRMEAIVTLAGIAAATRVVRIGTACLATMPLRHPVLLAAQWASLDCLSGGRSDLVACIGGAGPPGLVAREFAAMGVSQRERVPRMLEGMRILRALWAGEEVDYEGTYHQFSGVTIGPRPIQQPCPIWIANGPKDPAIMERLYRRVARHADGWMTGALNPETFRERWAFMRDLRMQETGQLDGFRSALHLRCHVDNNRERAYSGAKAFLDRYYSLDHDLRQLEDACVIGTPEDCVEKFVRYVAAGCNVIIIRLLGLPLSEQLERWVNEVIPEVTRRVRASHAAASGQPAQRMEGV